jgi:hypothetical protein
MTAVKSATCHIGNAYADLTRMHVAPADVVTSMADVAADGDALMAFVPRQFSRSQPAATC